MFDDIVDKIIKVSLIFLVIAALISVGYGFVFFEDQGIVAIIIAVAFFVLAWVPFVVLNGFGQLIENTDIIADFVKRKENELGKVVENTDTIANYIKEGKNGLGKVIENIDIIANYIRDEKETNVPSDSPVSTESSETNKRARREQRQNIES